MGAGVVGVYLLLIAVPWVSDEDDQEAVRSSRCYVALDLLLQRLFLPATAVLAMQLVRGVAQHPVELPVWLAMLLALFLFTTFQLGNATQMAKVTLVHRVDIQHAVGFTCLVRLLQTALLFTMLLSEGIGGDATQMLAWVAAGLSAVWLVGECAYPRSCSMFSIVPIRVSGAAIVTAATLLNALGAIAVSDIHSHLEEIATGCCGIALLGVVASIAVHFWQHYRQQALLAQTELPRVLEAIQQLQGRVVTTRVCVGRDEVAVIEELPTIAEISSPQQVALALRNFESCVLADRMSLAFLQRRASWLAEVEQAQTSFAQLAVLAEELHAEIQDPHTYTSTLTLLRDWSPGGQKQDSLRLPYWVCMSILSYIAPVEFLEELSLPLQIIPIPAGAVSPERCRGDYQVSQFRAFIANLRACRLDHENRGAPDEAAAVVSRLIASEPGFHLYHADGRRIHSCADGDSIDLCSEIVAV